MLLFGWGFFFFFFFCLLAPFDSASDPLGLSVLLTWVFFPLDHSSTNTAYADTPSLSFHNVDGLRVRNTRHSTSSETLCVRKICS